MEETDDNIYIESKTEKGWTLIKPSEALKENITECLHKLTNMDSIGYDQEIKKIPWYMRAFMDCSSLPMKHPVVHPKYINFSSRKFKEQCKIVKSIKLKGD